MTAFDLPNTISNGDSFDATPVQGNFTAIENELNALDGANIQAGTVTDAALANNPETIRDETVFDQVVTGLSTSDPGSSLTATTTTGTAYIEGVRVVKGSGTPKTYTASKDTYVDLDKNGTFYYTEVANGASAPAVTANSIRLCKVVTNGSEVTSVADMRVIGNTLGYAEITASVDTTATPTTTDITGLSTTVNVPSGGRRVKITVYIPNVVATGAVDVTTYIREGSTTLSYAQQGANVGVRHPSVVMYSTVASAGTHVYKASFSQSGSGTLTAVAGAAYPAFILVELV